MVYLQFLILYTVILVQIDESRHSLTRKSLSYTDRHWGKWPVFIKKTERERHKLFEVQILWNFTVETVRGDIYMQQGSLWLEGTSSFYVSKNLSPIILQLINVAPKNNFSLLHIFPQVAQFTSFNGGKNFYLTLNFKVWRKENYPDMRPWKITWRLYSVTPKP